ncbi:MAG: S8 family serine peptidase, partial [Dehalococcoidia bacterium]|nr:S8 family serine peptidase [Dehalococcoidia bacterium]
GTGFGDGLGFACNVVNDAFENGVLWVNSAGNYATSQYSGMMRDVDSDGYHDFDEGMEVLGLQDVRVGDEIDIWLTWNDWPSTKQDYDLLLVRLESDGSYRAVEKSDTKQVIDPPQEHLTHIVASPGQYGIVVWRARDALIRMFKVLSRYHDFEKHASVTGTISIPADAHGALTVGAINYTNWLTGPVETFSSQGPTVDGRVKPDLVAPDGVTTTGYGSGGFFGTSAAAPHVGGAAALLKSTNPTHYTAQRLWQALTDAAVDMGVRGRDNVYGWGRLDLSSILQGTPDIELSVAALAFGNATIGGSKSQSFIVKNTGNASLLVDEMTVASHQMDYEVFPASFSVAPNRIRTATVTFTPSTEGAKSTTLTVSSNDPGTPLATVSLSGSATKVPP